MPPLGGKSVLMEGGQMSMIYYSLLAGNFGYRTGSYAKRAERQEEDGFDACCDGVESRRKSEGEEAGRTSVVEEYKAKHPQDASHVSAQVNAGKAVRRKCGGEHVDTGNMTMEEYQAHFYSMLSTIPYHPTRLNDDVIISISEEGWEQMKNDPEYEAWVLGYFVEDRAVPNPFFGWGGNGGSLVIEHFGASIEEHHGEGFSKSDVGSGGSKTEREQESWWDKRHKRMKKALKEQAVKAQEKASARERKAQKEYLMHQLENQQRLHRFLTAETESDLHYLTNGQSMGDSLPVNENIVSILKVEGDYVRR